MIHKELAEGRWEEFSLADQMANVGSEVFRSINWKKKATKYTQIALLNEH